MLVHEFSICAVTCDQECDQEVFVCLFKTGLQSFWQVNEFEFIWTAGRGSVLHTGLHEGAQSVCISPARADGISILLVHVQVACCSVKDRNG